MSLTLGLILIAGMFTVYGSNLSCSALNTATADMQQALRFGVDLDDDLIIEDSDSAYLSVGIRRGGNSYYALDITDPDAPKSAWTIKGDADGTEGLKPWVSHDHAFLP